MVCATRIVSAVWRNENPWPSENTMEKQHPNKRKQHSEPELATNRRAEIWRCARPWAPCPAVVVPRPPARVAPSIVSQQAAPLPPPSEVRSGRAGSGPGSRQTEAVPPCPPILLASAAGYDPIA
jgi:hypothetical protein